MKEISYVQVKYHPNMKRNYEIKIRLTKDEHEKLKQKVSKTGFSLSSYARFLLVYSDVKVKEL